MDASRHMDSASVTPTGEKALSGPGVERVGLGLQRDTVYPELPKSASPAASRSPTEGAE